MASTLGCPPPAPPAAFLVTLRRFFLTEEVGWRDADGLALPPPPPSLDADDLLSEVLFLALAFLATSEPEKDLPDPEAFTSFDVAGAAPDDVSWLGLRALPRPPDGIEGPPTP